MCVYVCMCETWRILTDCQHMCCILYRWKKGQKRNGPRGGKFELEEVSLLGLLSDSCPVDEERASSPDSGYEDGPATAPKKRGWVYLLYGWLSYFVLFRSN
jgi:hypothetical protein